MTPKAREKVDKDRLTQVGRALKDLKIEHIPSYSPQARGRMERVWDTLQKRLPPLLRLEEIKTIEAANRWLSEVYLAQHNARFTVNAADEGTAFVPFVGDLENILCSCPLAKALWERASRATGYRPATPRKGTRPQKSVRTLFAKSP